MASGVDCGDSENDKRRGGSGEKCCSDPATDDSSESDGDAQPTKAFHRRISTSKAIKNGEDQLFEDEANVAIVTLSAPQVHNAR
ncbi:hypothetical protein HPB52_011551 [Rhipicephalus sanguineus]|uniref:Uncharacterized protein n=1 Tax=Rhipicephalus sanguineus TaxID=34632 RepID=A0A9D4Q0H8_RHISA|nr:hypothetical protein HPB52_011551 [Rhipicephalus sanguineus]